MTTHSLTLGPLVLLARQAGSLVDVSITANGLAVGEMQIALPTWTGLVCLVDVLAAADKRHAEDRAEVERLTAQLSGAEAANATTTAALVEHSELTGHIDIVEQCRDYLAHEITDEGDPSGKLQDFVDSLRVAIDQLDVQRRSRNWYETAYQAGKQKLVEYALSKVCCKGEPHTCDQEAVAAADGRHDRLRESMQPILSVVDDWDWQGIANDWPAVSDYDRAIEAVVKAMAEVERSVGKERNDAH